jgi:hypothetical protein
MVGDSGDGSGVVVVVIAMSKQLVMRDIHLAD